MGDAGPLGGFYQGYLDCLNRRDWPGLAGFVAGDVQRNGEALGLSGYQRLLQGDVALIPDLRFQIRQLATTTAVIAARLAFDCHPHGLFLGLQADGRRLRFDEHVFYRLEGGLIRDVASLIDREAIAGQLAQER